METMTAQTSTATATATTAYGSMPKWAQRISDEYTEGRAYAFILHFNVSDYVEPGVMLRQWLPTALLSSREIIAFYNRAEGITFPLPSMKDKASRRLDALTTGTRPAQPAQPSAAADPLASALGGIAARTNAAAAAATGDWFDKTQPPAKALPLLEMLMRSGPGVAVIIEYADSVFPNGAYGTMSPEDRTNIVTAARWGNDPELGSPDLSNPIILITANLTDLNPSIRAAAAKYQAVEIPLPDRAARRSFVARYAAARPEMFRGEMNVDALATATAGLGYMSIEDIFLRAESVGTLTYDAVTERKRDVIASEFRDVLEVLDPRVGFEAIGGHAHVKEFFTRNIIRPMRDGRVERVPQGVLLLGPAGTGKTAMAKALAKEAGLNFILLKASKLMGGIVGETEKNVEKAITAIQSLAPCIVFVDEIDQAVSQRGGSNGDSGVSARMFQRLLEFMGETSNRGRVLFLAASNRPDLIDAAMRRAGRFDKKIAFLLPDDGERREIVAAHLAARGRSAFAIPDEVVTKTKNWSGADLEALVVKAIELESDEVATDADAVIEAARRLRKSPADLQDAEYMTRLALLEINDLDLLPRQYWAMLDEPTQLTEEVERIAERRADRMERGRRTL